MNRKLYSLFGVAVAVLGLTVSARSADAQYVIGGANQWNGYGNPPAAAYRYGAPCGCGTSDVVTPRMAAYNSYVYSAYGNPYNPSVGCCGIGNCGMGCGLFGLRQCCNTCGYPPVMGVASYNAITNGACLNPGYCGQCCGGCLRPALSALRSSCYTGCLQSVNYACASSCCSPAPTCCGVQPAATTVQPAAPTTGPAPEPTPDPAPAPTAPTPDPAVKPAA